MTFGLVRRQAPLVSFATYVLLDRDNVLDAEKAFVSLALFYIVRFPLMALPHFISFLVAMAVAVRRIDAFMNAEELDPEAVTHRPDEGKYSARPVVSSPTEAYLPRQSLGDTSFLASFMQRCAIGARPRPRPRRSAAAQRT